MKEKLKEAGSALGGCAILLVLAALPVLFLYGGVKVAPAVYPWLVKISAVTLLACLFFFLPMGIFRGSRGWAGLGLFVSSYVFGITLWIWGLILSYVLWGWVGLVVGLFMAGIGVVPIAMLATAFNGMWAPFGELWLMVVLTFGARAIGVAMADSADAR